MKEADIPRHLPARGTILAICIMASLFFFAIYHYIVRDETGIDSEKERARIEEVMHWHESEMSARLDDIAQYLSDPSVSIDTIELRCHGNGCVTHHDYSFYIFRDNELAAWHNAVLPFTDIRPKDIAQPLFVNDNGWYYVQQRNVGRYSAVALLKLRSEYPYSNDYLSNEFHSSFGLPGNTSISTEKKENGIHIEDSAGHYLFSVVGRTAGVSLSDSMAAFCFIVLALAVIMLLIVEIQLVLIVAPRCSLLGSMTLSAVLFICLYIGTLQINEPSGLAQMFFFSVQVFAYDWWMPSLIHLFMLAGLFLIWCYLFYHLLDRNSCLPLAESRWTRLYGHLTGMIVCSMPLFVFTVTNLVIEWLVLHSSSLVVYIGELDIDGISLIKLSIIALATMANVYVFERIYSIYSTPRPSKRFIVLQILSVIVSIFVGISLFNHPGNIIYTVGYVALSLFFLVIKHRSPNHIRFSHFIWTIVFASIFIMARLTFLNNNKESQNRLLLAENLSLQLMREDDAVAEQHLSSIQKALVADSFVIATLQSQNIDEVKLYSYVRNRYFNGYFSRYDMQIIPCISATSTIQLNVTGEQYDCRSFFSSLIADMGIEVEKADHFYCLNDADGLPCYLGCFSSVELWADSSDIPANLFIQLDHKSFSQTVGYPELLTSKRDRLDINRLKDYSYAKYDHNIISSSYGEFEYPQSLNVPEHCDGLIIGKDGFSHLICQHEQHQTIVLSYPQLTILQLLTDYSYLFLCTLIVCVLVMAIFSRRHELFHSGLTISERFHASFVCFVTLLFIVICLVSGLQSMRHFEQDSRKRLGKVMSTVSEMLVTEHPELTADHLANDPEIPIEIDNILQRTSNLFNADAHIYTTDGRLVSSSKREIFMSGLQAPLMNDEALRILRGKVQEEIFIQETVGSLVYLSLYSTIYDKDNKLMGYINVPYFSDIRTQRRQLLLTIKPIANSLLLIILLAIIFSYFLADSIVRPLVTLSDTLRQVDLNKHNFKLSYPINDEIGHIVTAYNHMTDQLEQSAKRIAATEREATWRDMARQIAHEIKNPLTPMKLSVQFLLKLWETRHESFESKFKDTMQNLVDQIDSMATIASQFSNLAKNKQSDPVRMDIAQRVKGVADIFSKSKNASIEYSGPLNGIYVMADPDHITGVINNLIKNALQSMPEEEYVYVHISLKQKGNDVYIAVADNGSGISPEVQERMFRPNFTTKSSGMGLGLAIAKTVIDNSGGAIWYETEMGRGTTFFVRLPMCLSNTTE